jgi:hypothetical protein
MWSGTLWVTFTRLCLDSLLSCPFQFGQTCHKSHLQSVIFYFFAAISEISFPVAKVDVLHASSHLLYVQRIHSGCRMSQPLPSIKKALGLDSSSHRGMLKLSEAYPHELVASLAKPLYNGVFRVTMSAIISVDSNTHLHLVLIFSVL